MQIMVIKSLKVTFFFFSIFFNQSHQFFFFFQMISISYLFCNNRQLITKYYNKQVTSQCDYPFMHAHGSPRLVAGHLDALLPEELHEGAGGGENTTVDHGS